MDNYQIKLGGGPGFHRVLRESNLVLLFNTHHDILYAQLNLLTLRDPLTDYKTDMPFQFPIYILNIKKIHENVYFLPSLKNIANEQATDLIAICYIIIL